MNRRLIGLAACALAAASSGLSAAAATLDEPAASVLGVPLTLIDRDGRIVGTLVPSGQDQYRLRLTPQANGAQADARRQPPVSPFASPGAEPLTPLQIEDAQRRAYAEFFHLDGSP
ncbi:MAG: hypothetical protein ACREM2_05615 [Vulcanimicrobiaceae bacterium]